MCQDADFRELYLQVEVVLVLARPACPPPRAFEGTFFFLIFFLKKGPFDMKHAHMNICTHRDRQTQTDTDRQTHTHERTHTHTHARPACPLPQSI